MASTSGAVAHRAFAPPGGAAATIGPNAVLQLVPALRGAGLPAPAIFAAAGVAEWLSDPPGHMVDEHRVARLHRAVRAAVPAREAAAVMAHAGRLTADYLLAHRIPRPARVVLRVLPARLAAVLLVRAIRAHAWTFAGSGRFRAATGHPTIFTIAGNPLCAGETAPAPLCAWHAAVFRRLFAVLVSPEAEVAETACEACGDPGCRFEVAWRGGSAVSRAAAN